MNPQYSPPQQLEPIVASDTQQGATILLAEDGSVYTFGNAHYYGGPHENKYGENWKNLDGSLARHGAEIRFAWYSQLPYTVRDTAGEFYDYGYAPGQQVLRWS